MDVIPKKPGIYLLRNKINGKIYIGKSVNIRNRMYSYKNKDLNCIGSYIHKAITKYGWENFEVVILEIIEGKDNKFLLDREAELIKQYNALDKNIGYNLCAYHNDLTGVPLSEEVKKKMSERMMGKYCGELNPFYGKSHSEETKRILSEKQAGKHDGENNPFFGKKHTEEMKAHLSKVKKGKSLLALRRKIAQIDLKTGEVVKIWDSLTLAAQSVEGSAGNLVAVCKGKWKSAYGFGWAYFEEENNEVSIDKTL